MEKKLPYTRVNKELNRKIARLMRLWNKFVDRCYKENFDVRFASDDLDTLRLYYHDDYPNMLLVDKTCIRKNFEVEQYGNT